MRASSVSNFTHKRGWNVYLNVSTEFHLALNKLHQHAALFSLTHTICTDPLKGCKTQDLQKCNSVEEWFLFTLRMISLWDPQLLTAVGWSSVRCGAALDPRALRSLWYDILWNVTPVDQWELVQNWQLILIYVFPVSSHNRFVWNNVIKRFQLYNSLLLNVCKRIVTFLLKSVRMSFFS